MTKDEVPPIKLPFLCPICRRPIRSKMTLYRHAEKHVKEALERGELRVVKEIHETKVYTDGEKAAVGYLLAFMTILVPKYQKMIMEKKKKEKKG